MLEGMGRDEMRAADADRQAVADRLRVALEEGRLDLHEYDERVGRAYAAKTYGDLDRLLTDLPAVSRQRPPAEPVVRYEHATAQWIAQVWSGWVPVVLITTVIWAFGGFGYYWPAWVAAPWGAVLLWTTVVGLATGKPAKAAEERAHKELAKQQKREREADEASQAARGELPPGDRGCPA